MLEFFWRSIPDGGVYEQVCLKLIEAEGVHVDSIEQVQGESSTSHVDASAKVVLEEPAGFRRLETWWFEFKHYPSVRLSAATLREAEHVFSGDSPPHVVCLVTSDDLTSVSRYVAAESPRIRVWDRKILDSLVNRHLDVLRTYFEEYPKAVEELSRRLASKEDQDTQANSKEFTERLANCPTGKEHFSEYENIGIDVIEFLFPEHLGEPKPQSWTLDAKQRMDVLFRNNRSSRFFDRLFHRFDADSLIVDFKNYGKAIEPAVVFDVKKYANKAVGKFILVVSRKGPASSVEAAQLRIYRDSNTIVLVVSDKDLLEMIQRKGQGQNPEDVLEDKLDELLRKY